MILGLETVLAMLDPSVCPTTAAAPWAGFTWQAFNLVSNPKLVLPFILTLIILPWLAVKPKRLKRLLSGLGVVLLGIYLASASPIAIALASRGLVSFLPPDTGQTADAIVILGRGHDLSPSRVGVATALWKDQRAPMVFTSGRGDAPEMLAMLRQNGVPESASDGEPCSSTTEENAQFTAEILQPKGIKRIILVTDPPHIMRSYLTFRSLGFEVIPHSSPLSQTIGHRTQGFLVAREYVGLIAYGLLGRYSPRTVQPLLTTHFSENHHSIY